jgi:hypothetical protein
MLTTLKLSLFSLYKDRNCPYCDIEDFVLVMIVLMKCYKFLWIQKIF